jgi:hypothetical protein
MSDSAKGLYNILMDMINDNKDHRWDADIKQSLDMLENLVGMAEDSSDYDTAIRMARRALSESVSK